MNGEYRDDDSPIGILIDDFACTNPVDMQYKVLAERKQTAIRLIKAGKLSNEEIAVGVNLTLEEVQELAEEISEIVMA